jgi:hypothetical protein
MIAPYGRSNHQMVFDEANQVIVMHGGSVMDTWTFGIDLAITAQPESVVAEVGKKMHVLGVCDGKRANHISMVEGWHRAPR